MLLTRVRDATPHLFPAVAIIIGFLLLIIAWSMPAYVDPDWEVPFYDLDASAPNTDEISAQWYEAKAAAETSRNMIADLGIALTLLGVTVAAIMALKGIRKSEDLAVITSPTSKFEFFILAAMAWLSLVPADLLALSYELRRGDFPWWADSIGIPATDSIIVGAYGLPIVLCGVAVVLRSTELPVGLWIRPAWGHPYVIVSLVWIAIALNAGLFLLAMLTSPFLVPSFVVILYLLLSGRAAAVASKNSGRN